MKTKRDSQKKFKTLSNKDEIKKLIRLFANKTGCGIQFNNCPCNSCFHSINNIDFKHICWLILLGLRGDYKSDDILKSIKMELKI